MNIILDHRFPSFPALFSKDGSRAHFARIFMALSSALLFFLVLHHWSDRSHEYETLLEKENAKLGVAGNLINFHLNEVLSSMAILADDPVLQTALLHPLPANQHALRLDLSPYVEQEETPDEVLLVNIQGEEIVHVSTTGTSLTPLEEIRPILKKAMALEKKRAYLSPLPQTGNASPTLYLAVPVFHGETKIGTLLATYTATQFKHLLDDILGPTLGHVVILNHAGVPIYDRQAGNEGILPPWDPTHLPQTQPVLWKEVLSAPSKKIDDDKGWLLYTTIDLAHNLFLHSAVDAEADNSSSESNNRHEWKIISMIPHSAVNLAWGKRLQENLPIYLLMICGTGLFAWQRAQRRQEAKHAEMALKSSQEMLVTVLDSMETAVYVTDMDSHEILFANRHLCRTLGKADLVGKLCWQELHTGQKGPCDACGTVELGDGQNTRVWEYQNPMTGRWTQVRLNAISWVDGRMARLEIATDITEQKESLALRSARKLAMEKNSRFNIAEEMASGLAHELSQPLTAAHNYLDACLRLTETAPLEAEKLCKGLRLAHMQTERAGKIISHIKNTIRKRSNEKGPHDINQLIRDTVEYLEYEIRHHGVTVEQDLDPLPFITSVNGVEIEQVLLNLMRNAIDSMHDTPERRLMLGSRPTKTGSILVQISDTGKGISHADLDFIFNPFLTTKNDGLGLGLTICRTIVESYGGRIWAESSAGHGATFCFTLPGERSNE